MYLDYEKEPNKYWVGDTEADDLRPSRFWCAVFINLGTGERVTFRPEDIDNGQSRRWCLEHSDDYFVFHNGVSFDCRYGSRLGSFPIPLNKCVDTLVLSYLYNPHLPGGHSLEAYGERLGQAKLGHEDWSQFSPEMLRRCEVDTELGLKVYKALVKKLLAIGYSETSCRIEHEIRAIIDTQQENGFQFDLETAKNFCEDRQREIDQLEVSIFKLFPPQLKIVGEYEYKINKNGKPRSLFQKHEIRAIENGGKIQFNKTGDKYRVLLPEPFDLASPNQRRDRLLELGWKPKTFTPKGSPKVDEASLLEFAETSKEPAIKALAEWLVKTSRKTMVEGWIKAAEKDGKIHGTVFTCGAATRRMRHNNPNTANIPSESNKAAYGHECRSLWTARPGRVLVGYDASGLEMRGFCHYLNNPEATKLYIEGDPHQSNADALTAALQFPVIRGGGGAKTLFYAFLYGSGDEKLGLILGGKTKAERMRWGAIVRATLLNNVPGLSDLVSQISSELDQHDGRLQTIDGGWVICPSPHAALNYKVQSAGGIVMKQATIRLDQKIKEFDLDVLRVGDVHDEGQLDSAWEHGYMAGCCGVQSIVQAGEDLGFNVPLYGDFKIGHNWAQTH